MSDASAADPASHDGFGSVEAVKAAVARARTAFTWWSEQSIKQRTRMLLAFRDILLDRMDDVALLVGDEVGKPKLDVVGEIFQICNLISYCARQGPKLLRRRRVSSWPLIHKRAWTEYSPLGVVGAITPWNYPVVLVLAPAVQALTTGNAVVVKPSEFASRTALLLEELFRELHLPKPVFQVVPGGHDAAIALIEAGVDKIAFTGGARGGRAIAEAAARKLIPVLLELGGSDAMIVAADADLERAARGAVWGAFFNAGQSCIAVERCFVERPIAKQFTQRVVELTREIRQASAAKHAANDGGDKAGWDRDIGPLCTRAQFDRVRALVDDAVAAGATVLTGGVADQQQSSDRLFPPTILTNVTPAMKLMREEVFGPVLGIQPVDDLRQAVEQTNGSSLGLSASVWSRDISKARELARHLNVGGVVINDCLVHFAIPDLPFGGVRDSGIGRTHGKEGLLEYCHVKSYAEHRFGPKFEFHWFPAKRKHRLLSRLVRLLYRSGTKRFRTP